MSTFSIFKVDAKIEMDLWTYIIVPCTSIEALHVNQWFNTIYFIAMFGLITLTETVVVSIVREEVSSDTAAVPLVTVDARIRGIHTRTITNWII